MGAVSDGNDLALILRPGNGHTRTTIAVERLRPHRTYHTRGARDPAVTADPTGRALIEIDLNDRLELHLYPTTSPWRKWRPHTGPSSTGGVCPVRPTDVVVDDTLTSRSNITACQLGPRPSGKMSSGSGRCQGSRLLAGSSSTTSAGVSAGWACSWARAQRR